MNWRDWLSWVSRALRANPLRSLLTIVGIAMGIFSVVILTSLGEGLRLYMLDSFSQFGTRIIAVSPGKVTTQGMAGVLKSVKPLTIADAESLRTLPYVEQVVPVVNGTGRIEIAGRARNSDIFGVGHEAAQAWNFAVAQGRFLPPDDPDSARAYAVLGYKLKNELFRHQNALGEMVRVGGMRFRVIGVMESKGQLLGFDLDDVIYIPTGRALQLFNRDSLMEIDIVFNQRSTSSDMSRRIIERLKSKHGREDFTLFTQEDMLASLNKILGLLTLVVAGLGGISLFVGGIGVLTIMTTALSERTFEIGLLCSLGCTRARILHLFLGEAVYLSTMGGILGLVLASLLVLLLRLLITDLPLALNMYYLFAALLFSACVGLASGIIPAIRASRLNPIDALRDE